MFNFPMGSTSLVGPHVTQVLIMSHELSKEKEMTSYFAKKFAPAPPLVVMGRSYKSSPECKPENTLFDNWQDISRTHPQGTIASWERCLQKDLQLVLVVVRYSAGLLLFLLTDNRHCNRLTTRAYCLVLR